MLENFRLVKDEEQNWAYDPDKACNGGGYHQPFKVWEFEYGYYDDYYHEISGKYHYKFELDDTSCGDFGKRYSKTLYIMEDGEWKEVYNFYLNEVDGNDDETVCEGTFEPVELTAALIDARLLKWWELFSCEIFDRFNYDKFKREQEEEEEYYEERSRYNG